MDSQALVTVASDRSLAWSARPRAKGRNRLAEVVFEQVESRLLMSCSAISGYVYLDANNDGIRQATEAPIVNSPLALKNALGQVVATTTSDASGYYIFDQDQTVDPAQAFVEQVIQFPQSTTNWTKSGAVNQFDPALGTLVGVEVIHSGSVTTRIFAENLGLNAQTVTTSVNATMVLTGPSVNCTLSISSSLGQFSAGAFDGTIDFGGTSGFAVGPVTLSDSTTVYLNQPVDLAPYIGTGIASVSFTDQTVATSQATGGGNLVAGSTTSASGDVTVRYHYLPSTCLRPGDYTIVQTQQPTGLVDGYETAGNTYPIPVSAGGPDVIHVTLGSSDLTNNNFGEEVVTTPVQSGMAATIGFWQNKNGQALIRGLNGGPTATALGNWLAGNFPNMFGSLAGKSNQDIAAYFKQLFKMKGMKLEAQVLGVAFAVYVTDADLAGTSAAQYGFTVSTGGLGGATWNVGGSGAAFGLPDNTETTVYDLLRRADALSDPGTTYGGESWGTRVLANEVFDGINNVGDIL